MESLPKRAKGTYRDVWTEVHAMEVGDVLILTEDALPVGWKPFIAAVSLRGKLTGMIVRMHRHNGKVYMLCLEKANNGART